MTREEKIIVARIKLGRAFITDKPTLQRSSPKSTRLLEIEQRQAEQQKKDSRLGVVSINRGSKKP